MPSHAQDLLGALEDGNDRELGKGRAGNALAFARDEGEECGVAVCADRHRGGTIVLGRQAAQLFQYVIVGLGHDDGFLQMRGVVKFGPHG